MEGKKSFNTTALVLCALFSALIAVGAFIKIPVPYVPFSLQFLFTNLAGILLGKKYGAVSVAVYMAVGLVGIPVFTGGGGLGYIFQPTFGYIIGFLVGAFVTGSITHKSQNPSYKRMVLAGLAGLGVVYLLGMIYFYIIKNFYMNSSVDIWWLILNCFLIFLPGDIAICFLSALLSKKLLPIMKKNKKSALFKI